MKWRGPQISPPFYAVTFKGHASMRMVPFTPGKNDSSRSCLSGYSDHPNYMSYTESSQAKVSFGVSSEINHKKLQTIEHLIQKLTRLNSTHDEAHTDYIASLSENTKPDDRYISEILLASGLLLTDLGSSLTTFQFHSSSHPINPELFLVLEQTKFSNLPKQDHSNKKLLNKEKFHRKLIFDTVNEVLAKKLALVVPSLESFSSKSFKLANKTLNGQKLLRDLCMEIEELLQVKKKKEDVSLDEEDDGLKTILWEEVLNRAESWTDYDGELPVIALEVERLIFKDLVNEVVLGEASHGKRIQPGRCHRRLSSK
ncbi:longifolia 1-like protein [Tanacetum coccineum]|uniref:Longifolia 1-like protein n=1 Tax=Tanacetum coccineum TaxID=301880 RepID=A0ABQ5F1C1_9ASTR